VTSGASLHLFGEQVQESTTCQLSPDIAIINQISPFDLHLSCPESSYNQ
jgi:hypothetical protein